MATDFPLNLVHQLTSLKDTERADCFKQIVSALRQAATSGDVEIVRSVFRVIVQPTLDFTSTQSLIRVLKELRKQAPAPAKRTRLAVLGSFTTKQLVSLIDLFLFSTGVDAEIYEADYNLFRQEIIDPTSELYQFKPQFIYLATSTSDLSRRPSLPMPRAEVEQLAQSEFDSWNQLWKTANERLGCEILQNNFVPPTSRQLVNYELRQPGSLSSFVARMNQKFYEEAPPFVSIHDVENLSSLSGRSAWQDMRFVHLAKMPCAPEFLVDYAHSVSSIFSSKLGHGKKCLVLDCDNTLWGGVIGDDGLNGIRIGQGEAEGEAFLAFQQYARSLKERGIILAVCSKNFEATAREVFAKHPEMALREDDISCFMVNWDDKAGNIRKIASMLNIGLNSLVFADDNPAERAIIRQVVPEVAVPELPEDPAGYIDAIESHRYFQVTSLNAEDLSRTSYYRADAQRAAAESTSTDMPSFLRSLEMVATIGPINENSLDRCAQLIQRSNQFNLTTRRHSSADLQAMCRDDSWVTLTISLADRFGDNGLISIAIGKVMEGTLLIDTWLMSCRVLKRGVEHLMLAKLAEQAHAKGLGALHGVFIRTPKNNLVEKHYESLGFVQMDSRAEGQSDWKLNLASFTPPEYYISERTI